MADKERQSPMQTNGYHRTDDNGALEKRNQKRKKWIIYGSIFVIAHIIMIVVFALVILKFKTPKYRLRSASFDTFNVGQDSNNASFNLKMKAELAVKNPNWGAYKYGNTAISFYYGDVLVGSGIVRKSDAGFKSTKKVKNVMVDLVSPTGLGSNSELGKDLSSGMVSLRSESKLNGKITIMMFFKKRKITNLNCTMDVNINTKQLQNVKCTT